MGLVIQEKRKGYVYIKLVGKRDFFSELLKGLCMLGTIMEGNQRTHLLIDYSKIELNLTINKSNILRLVSVYEVHLKKPQKVGVLLDKKHMPEARLFVDYCKARGLNNEVFSTLKDAEQWLKAS